MQCNVVQSEQIEGNSVGWSVPRSTYKRKLPSAISNFRSTTCIHIYNCQADSLHLVVKQFKCLLVGMYVCARDSFAVTSISSDDCSGGGS